jgi:DNA-binding transcriptional LysR family regulator
MAPFGRAFLDREATLRRGVRDSRRTQSACANAHRGFVDRSSSLSKLPNQSHDANRITDWDDLRVFLAVVRGRSVSAGARTLGVNHATVSRRIRAFERRVGTRLLERLAGGWATTAAGEEMLATALRVEDEMQALDRRVAGRDAQLSGKLRVALSDAAAFGLMEFLAAFAAANPNIELELTASNGLTNLTRREADVAIRVVDRPAEHLVGRQVGRTALALFGAIARLDAAPAPVALAEYAWLGWDESMQEQTSRRWLRENLPEVRFAARFDSMLVAYHAVRAGVGIAFLPCALGDADSELRRVIPDLVLPGTAMWLLTHPDLRRTARVRCFLDFMAEAMVHTRDLREGRRPRVS